jgi:hypothetical protein
MKKFFGLLLVAGLVLTTACGEKKVEEAPAHDATAPAADTTAAPAAADTAAKAPAAEAPAHGSGH